MSSSQGTMIYLYLQLIQRNQVFTVKMTFKVMENFIFNPLKLIILRFVSCVQCCLYFCIINWIPSIYFFTLWKYLFIYIRNFFVVKLITIFLQHRFVAVISFLCSVSLIIVHLFLIYPLYFICSFSIDVSFLPFWYLNFLRFIISVDIKTVWFLYQYSHLVAYSIFNIWMVLYMHS